MYVTGCLFLAQLCLSVDHVVSQLVYWTVYMITFYILGNAFDLTNLTSLLDVIKTLMTKLELKIERNTIKSLVLYLECCNSR